MNFEHVYIAMESKIEKRIIQSASWKVAWFISVTRCNHATLNATKNLTAFSTAESFDTKEFSAGKQDCGSDKNYF